jgi:WD40 repeat protein
VSLFISNADGSGSRLLGPGSIPSSEVVISPAGDRFAYISKATEDDPHLVIRLVPGGELETDIALVSPDVKRAISDQDGIKDQILSAVGDVGSLSWSPSGHYLAFIAALEGSDTDVYRFDTWSNNIRQLTSNSLNAYFPIWSPDGDWVLHLKGVSIGGLVEMNMDGMWVVSPDGSSTKRLYDSGGGVDFLVNWIDGTTFYTSRDTRSGHYDLTRRKVDGSTPNDVYSGPFAFPDQVSFDDLMSAVAFNIRPTDLAVDAGTSSGIYLASLGDGIADLVLPGDWRSVEWWPGKGVFLANGEEGTAFIRRTGEVVKRMDDIVNPIAPSPEGGWMISYGEDGARVYTHIGVFIQQIFDGPVAEVVWQPGDEGFFLEVYQLENPVIGHQLYVLDLSEWDMHLVDLDTRGGYFWMVSTLETP